MDRPSGTEQADARRLSVLLESIRSAVLLEDEERRIQLVNQAFCDMFAIPAPPAALIGADCTHAAEQSKALFADPEGFVRRVHALLAGRDAVVGEELRLADGRTLERDYIPISIDDAHRGHLWKYRDITSRVSERRRLLPINAVSRALVEGEREDAVCARVLTVLCDELGWDFGAVFLPGERAVWQGAAETEAAVLRPVACVSGARVDPSDTAWYASVTLTYRFAAGDGLPGRVCADGRAMWIADVSAAVDCPRLSGQVGSRCRTVVLAPMRGAGGLVGVIELVSADSRQRDDAVLRLIEDVGARLAQFVERGRHDRQRASGEAWTRTILDRMLDGLLVVDEATGRIVSVNQQAETMFGYERGGMNGLHVAELTPDRAPYRSADFLARAYSEAIGRTTQWDAKRRDGSTFPMELQLGEFDTPTGRVLTGFVRDVTERNSVERLKKQFVATVSHELRTPLTSIRGSLGLLRSGAVGPIAGEAREMIDLADRNVVRLIGLINDILDLERMESRALPIDLADVPMARVVARAVDAVHAVAMEHGNAIEVGVCDAVVRGDEERLVQVLVNLLSNATKFSPMGESVLVNCRVDGRRACVEVADRGPGVPEELRGIIFEPFKQAESSDSRRRSGSGLGLAISRAIVVQHGGRIGMEPRDGGGALFWITLPLAAAAS